MFKTDGRPIARLSLSQLVRRVAPVRVTIRDPHELQPVQYEALPLARLLQAIPGAYGKDSELFFRCADGYESSVAPDAWKRYGKHAYLAFGIRGRDDFRVGDRRHNGKTVDLGPYYLIWDTRSQASLRQLPTSYWPYQVTSIESTSPQKRLAAIRPPADAPPAAKRGFELFRTHCIACHSINGQGGHVGPELNYPVNVTEYFDRTWLARWITNPKQVRFNAPMPSLATLGIPAAEQARVTAAIIGYLEAMARRKVKAP